MHNKIDIVVFEPWMLNNIVELDVLQYGGDFDKRKKQYEQLLCSSYSIKYPPIALIGLLNRKVIATQLFFYWPYRKETILYNVFQSGGSLVHPGFRGQKIFQTMLSIGSKIGQNNGIDFFIGFPVPMSYGAFIKDGWIKIGDLRWWTKLLQPTKLFMKKLRKKSHNTCLQGEPLKIENILKYSFIPNSRICMENSKDFVAWRYNNDNINKYRYFEYGNGSVAFVYKLNLQHGFCEIVVGEIFIDNNNNKSIFSKALKMFCNEIKKSSDIIAISFALLNPSSLLIRGFLCNGFIPHKKAAPLIVKSVSTEAPTDIDLWDISLGDIDTW